MSALRALLRLAARDARRNLARTLTAVLLIAGPIAVAVPAVATTGIADTSRTDALATLPDGVSARLTATAVLPGSGPIPQTPEGVTPPLVADPGTVPASDADLRTVLGDDVDLRAWWRSPELIAATGLDAGPGEKAAVSSVEAVDGLDAQRLGRLRLEEAEPEVLGLLVPELVEGTLPASAQEVVLSASVAERLGVPLGGTAQLIAPPATGWMSTDGRIGEIMQDSVRGYRVVGIAADAPHPADDAGRAWAGAGWLQDMTARDGAGISRHLLALGDAPITWQQVRALNALQVVAVSRQVLEDYPPRDQLYPVAVDPQRLLLQATLAGVGAIASAVLLLLLITPAFLIGAERQRRETGLLVASGATPAAVRSLLLVQGAGLGLVSSGLGIGAGLALAALVRAQDPGGVAGQLAQRMGAVPAWVPVLLLGTGTALGLLATAPAAIRA
ncbi:ABC transporter permease, partial [Brachybacterium hainanense]